MNIAAELSGTSVEVILTGGTCAKIHSRWSVRLRKRRFDGLSADLLFLGVDGFDTQYGLSTPNLLEAKVNRVMVDISRRSIAVCDSSKFGQTESFTDWTADGRA